MAGYPSPLLPSSPPPPFQFLALNHSDTEDIDKPSFIIFLLSTFSREGHEASLISSFTFTKLWRFLLRGNRLWEGKSRHYRSTTITSESEMDSIKFGLLMDIFNPHSIQFFCDIFYMKILFNFRTKMFKTVNIFFQVLLYQVWRVLQ